MTLQGHGRPFAEQLRRAGIDDKRVELIESKPI
jgi:hypothetical protein